MNKTDAGFHLLHFSASIRPNNHFQPLCWGPFLLLDFVHEPAPARVGLPFGDPAGDDYGGIDVVRLGRFKGTETGAL